MTDQQHLITPPPGLVQQWAHEHFVSNGWTDASGDVSGIRQAIAIKAANWGADMELEACCEWFSEDPPAVAQGLRAARRPNWPSLKEQALDELDRIQTHDESGQEIVNLSVIRRALESLPD